MEEGTCRGDDSKPHGVLIGTDENGSMSSENFHVLCPRSKCSITGVAGTGTATTVCVMSTIKAHAAPWQDNPFNGARQSFFRLANGTTSTAAQGRS